MTVFQNLRKSSQYKYQELKKTKAERIQRKIRHIINKTLKIKDKKQPEEKRYITYKNDNIVGLTSHQKTEAGEKGVVYI